MQNLETVEMQSNVFETIPANIQWSPKISQINLAGNRNLKVIEEHAFSSALGLTQLILSGTSNLQVRSNGLHIKNGGAMLFMNDWWSTFDSNAFGNVDGGELWGKLDITVGNNFPEDVFRLMLKTASDKQQNGKYFTEKIEL